MDAVKILGSLLGGGSMSSGRGGQVIGDILGQAMGGSRGGGGAPYRRGAMLPPPGGSRHDRVASHGSLGLLRVISFDKSLVRKRNCKIDSFRSGESDDFSRLWLSIA